MAAYFIVDVKVEDPTTYEEYRKRVNATLERYGGKFLARGGAVETIEGDWQPQRLVGMACRTRTRGVPTMDRYLFVSTFFAEIR